MSAWRRAWDEHPAAVSAALVLLAALVASLSSLGSGFALDDVLIIEGRRRLHTLRAPLELLTTAYWQLPPDDTLWRPLGLLSFAAQWVVANGAATMFHVVSVVLYLLVSLSVLALAWTLLPPVGALAAGLVFAVHPVHVETVGNIVGQLELWVALATVGAAALYVHARRRGALDASTIALLLACYAIGLGMKEHAVLLPAYLLALEATVLRDAPSATSVRRAPVGTSVRILFGLCAALALVWLSVRSGIVDGLAGDRPHLALKGLGIAERSWVMLGLVPEFARLLLWPARLYADYSPQFVTLHTTPALAHLPGAALLLGGLGLLRWSWDRDRAMALGLLWIPIALALIANIIVPTGILLAERTLFLSTVGVALVLGAMLARALPRIAAWPASVRTLSYALGGAVLVLAAAHSAERQHVWENNDTLIASLVIDAPQNFRGHFWLGDELLRKGQLVEGEQSMRRAMALWPEHDGPPLGLALRYQERGMCRPALDLYTIARRIEPLKPTPHFGYAGCLLTIGRYHEARAAAFEGLATGRSAVAFRYLILQADSALAATDSVRSNNWWVRRRRTSCNESLDSPRCAESPRG